MIASEYVILRNTNEQWAQNMAKKPHTYFLKGCSRLLCIDVWLEGEPQNMKRKRMREGGEEGTCERENERGKEQWEGEHTLILGEQISS